MAKPSKEIADQAIKDIEDKIKDAEERAAGTPSTEVGALKIELAAMQHWHRSNFKDS